MKKLISILLLVVFLFSAAFAEYVPLEKGSKGDAVKELQQRLIDLGYLSDKADGSYGNKTKTAVEMFQREAGIAANGIADESTQEALFAEDAPKAKVYQKMDYKEFARNPDAHEDDLVGLVPDLRTTKKVGNRVTRRTRVQSLRATGSPGIDESCACYRTAGIRQSRLPPLCGF